MYLIYLLKSSLVIFLLLCSHFLFAQRKSNLVIEAGTSMSIIGGRPGNNAVINPYIDQTVTAELKVERSSGEVEVVVVDPKTGVVIKGFGLNNGSIASIEVAPNEKLIISGVDDIDSEVNVTISEFTPEIKKQVDTYVELTLVNSGLRSIPLIIPNVMNPNLSPKSRSGVSLSVGQKVFYKKDGKRILLFTVDETYTNGMEIDVRTLIDQL